MTPNCNKCKHFFVTFDQYASKGCRLFGIKSNRMPSIVVKDANDGVDCNGFELKDRLKEKNRKDLNDPKLW